jgi:hypothetical protein
VICPHPECTGVHDNNRYSELCPRSIGLKRAKDLRYYTTYPSGRGYWSRFLRRVEALQEWELRNFDDGSSYGGMIAKVQQRREAVPKRTRCKTEVICDRDLPRRRTSIFGGQVYEVHIPVHRTPL